MLHDFVAGVNASILPSSGAPNNFSFRLQQLDCQQRHDEETRSPFSSKVRLACSNLLISRAKPFASSRSYHSVLVCCSSVQLYDEALVELSELEVLTHGDLLKSTNFTATFVVLF